MLLRVMMISAVVTLPLGVRPMQAASQQHGLDRAVEASAHAATAPGQTKNHPGKQSKTLPPGIAKRFPDGNTLPPGIERTRNRPAPEAEPQPEPEPEPEPEPDPDPTQCDGVVVGGIPLPC